MKIFRMKKFRSLFITAALVTAGSTPLLVTSPAQANPKSPQTEKQRDNNSQKMRRNQMEMMAQYLELTDAQKAKIKPILEQSQQRSMKVRNDKSLSPEQKRAKMKTIREDLWKKINPILTDAQRKKMAAMRQNRGARSSGKSKR